ncbi:hypothetical protein JTE90_007909 [Oedothorax gibbosus]|uniref:Nucleolar protein 12 n=1 Tax=Oedothorax gibbosus TaxID=931172 RepID=A0AAV6VI85_9ARAC|nr:hypothetical protein JTE90_007909 [Oedothorax gibbosus]
MARKRGAKKPKVHLIFDEKERSDYLTGFHKRNLERKVKKKEQIDNMLKAEKRKIKQSTKEAFSNALMTQRSVPEIQHLLEPTTYDLPDHTVTITKVKDLTSIDCTTTMNMDGTVPTFSVAGKSQDEVDKLRKLIKDLKTKRVKTLVKSKAHGEIKRHQRKENKQKARRMRQLFQKGVKKTKKKNQKKQKK